MELDALIGASDAMNSNMSEVLHTQGSRHEEGADSPGGGDGQELFILKRLFQERQETMRK